MSEQAKLEVTGVLYKVCETVAVTEKLEKRDFVIETTDEQYPQLIKFELMNDKCKLLDGHKVGEKIKVSFNLRGREWKKDASTPPAYFTSLAAWRIVKADGNQEEHPYNPPASKQKTTEPISMGGDDLPF